MKNTSRMFTDHGLSEDYNYGSLTKHKTTEQNAEIVKTLLKIKLPPQPFTPAKIAM